jgi:hypothetical protein
MCCLPKVPLKVGDHFKCKPVFASLDGEDDDEGEVEREVEAALVEFKVMGLTVKKLKKVAASEDVAEGDGVEEEKAGGDDEEDEEEDGEVGLFEESSSELITEGEALDREEEDDALNEVILC